MPNHLRVIARAFDGLPEAVVMDKSEHPFMIAVQFHPERLGKENAIHQNNERVVFTMQWENKEYFILIVNNF